MDKFNDWGDILSAMGGLIEKYNEHNYNDVLTVDEKQQVSQDLIDLQEEIQEN